MTIQQANNLLSPEQVRALLKTPPARKIKDTLSPERKAEVVRRYLTHKQTVPEICDAMKLSRTMVYRTLPNIQNKQ